MKRDILRLSRWVVVWAVAGFFGLGSARLSKAAAPIQITSIDPTSGQGGTVIRVTGSGFGSDPNALAAGLLIGGGAIVPMRTVQGGLPNLHLGVFSSDVGTAGARIVVTRGQGRTGFFKPAFPDIVLREPAWVWLGNVQSASGVSTQQFTLRPTTPPAGTRWFFSGSPSNSALCVSLTGNWSPTNRVSIDVLAENPSLRLHRAAQLHGIEFSGSSLLGCAQRICDALRCAFNQMGMVTVNCEVDLVGAAAPTAKITLSFPEGPIARGGLMVCVEPANPPPTPVITGFSPRSGGEGTEITIMGQNFGSNPRNLSAAILNGESSLPLKVISATETQVVAVVGVVPPRALGGPIRLALGDGNATLVDFAHGDIRQPVIIGTLFQTGPSTASRDTFTPQTQPEPTWPKCFFSGPPSDGKVCLTISGVWPTPAKVSISAGLHDTRSGKGRDIQVDNVEFQSAIIPGNPPIIDPLNILECAYRICDVIGSGSLQGGGFVVNCDVELISPGVAQICLSMADGFVNQGHLNVCVQPALVPADDKWPTIIDFSPKEAFPGEVIRIIGRNFITDPDQGPNPDNISVAVVNGAMTIPMQAISINDNEILAVLDEVPPNARPGPIRVSLGRGAFGQLNPFHPDVEFKQTAWSWIGVGASADSVDDFTPHHRSPALNKRCFYSGPPFEGDLILVLPFSETDPNQWPSPAKVTIDLEGTYAYGLGSATISGAFKSLEVRLTGGGTLLQCAQRICDIIETLAPPFDQIEPASVPIPFFICSVEMGTNTVVIRVSAAAAPPGITSGHLNVCVEPGQIFLPLHIVDVFPSQGREGDVIMINGRNFGTRADNVCAVIMDGSNSIPLQVIEASDTQIRAVLGAVPPSARPGRIMVGLGAGGHGSFAPAFPDIEVRKPVWVWTKTGEAAMSVGMFTPQPTTPPAGTQWFFSGPPSNGVLCVFLTGAWPSNAQIRIEARAHNHSRGIGRDLRAIDIRLPAGGALLGCAQRICDVIRCAFLQQAGITVECIAEEVGRTTVKLTLRLPGGPIDWGNLNVCVRPSPEPQPVITSFTPRTGPMDTRVTINGNNFIGNPDETPDPHDYCLVQMNGALSTPFEVLSVTMTQIIARVGPVDPSARAGRLMLSLGQGQQGSFKPVFPDIVPGSQTWTWTKDGPDTTSQADFVPMPTTPPAGAQWFFSGPPSNGVLCVVIRGDWPRPAIVRIEARAHDHARRIGRDLRAVNVRFEGGGDTVQCALRICDVIRCAFLQQAGIAVNCTVTPSPTGDDSVKITLSLPEGHIDWGNLIVCVSSPPPPRPEITDVSPLRGAEGTLITILGRNFLGGPDTSLDDLSVVIMDGARAIAIEVLSATETMIQGRLGPVPFDARGGPVMVSLGEGQRGLFTPSHPDVRLLLPVWAWKLTGLSAVSLQPFFPQPNDPNFPNQNWFFSGPPIDGKLCLFIRTNWNPGSYVQVDVRAHDHNQGIGYDTGPIIFQLPGGGSVVDCALKICDVIQTVFFQLAGININCTVDLLPGPPNVKITLSLPNGMIDWGAFNICVAAPPQPLQPMPINLQPVQGSNGTLVTIRGRGFGDNADNLSLAVMNGASSILLRALRATDTEIVAEVGMVPPNARPGPIRIAKGVGRRVRLQSSLPQPLSANVPWTWNGLDPSVIAGLEFGPIFTGLCPPVGLVLPNSAYPIGFYSDTPVNGKLSVTLSGGWPFIAKVYLELQAHNDTLNVARELLLPCHFVSLPGSSSIMANSICNAITEAFQEQGVIVNCAVAPDNNGAKLTVSLPEGQIEWGSLKICVGDGEYTIPPRPQIKINPAILTNLVFSWPRSATGYELQVADHLGGDASGITIEWLPVPLLFEWGAPIPLGATDTELQVQIPIDPRRPQAFFRLFKPPGGPGPTD